MTKAERAHLDTITRRGCCVCRKVLGVFSPAGIHHVRRLETSKVRANAPVLGLCHNHHQGINGIHTIGRKAWEAAFGSELEYLKEETNVWKS